MRIGLDVGGTKTDAVAVDDENRVIARVRRATGWGADAVVRTVIDAVEELRGEVGDESGQDGAVRSVGIGIPGQIAPGDTRVVHAVNLGVDDLDLAAALEPVLGVRVRVENDVKAAAIGAYALHAHASELAASPGSVAYLNLGTGIAAGVVRDGSIWRGARGTAGEVGHISVDPAGPDCRCGQRGCIEAFAGGGAIALRWDRPGVLPVRDVFDAAETGDPLARELRAGLAFGVAAAVRVLVLTIDVDDVVLGGGIAALGDRLLDDVRAQLRRSADDSAFLRSLRLDERIALLPAGSPAAALGAALVGAAPREEVGVHG